MVDDHFSMTGTVDILESIANGTGPSRAMVALGYAGWGPGQIEDENGCERVVVGASGSRSCV